MKGNHHLKMPETYSKVSEMDSDTNNIIRERVLIKHPYKGTGLCTNKHFLAIHLLMMIIIKRFLYIEIVYARKIFSIAKP